VSGRDVMEWGLLENEWDFGGICKIAQTRTRTRTGTGARTRT
jgi:hypothetical protein